MLSRNDVHHTLQSTVLEPCDGLIQACVALGVGYAIAQDHAVFLTTNA